MSAADPTRQPVPPLDTLSGRWIVEAATNNGPAAIGSRFVLWGLQLRHADYDVVEWLRHFARPGTTFDVGQEIEGHVDLDREGPVFRRARPQVGRER